MANHVSAKKRIRQTANRTVRNRHIRSTVRTMVKNVRTAIESNDKDGATTALAKAVSHIDAAVNKGIYHRKAGSRYISRLTSQVHKL